MPCKPQPHIQLAIFQTLMVSPPAYDSELGLPGTGTRPRRGKLGTTRGTGETVGGACIIDRSGGRADVGCRLISLAQVNFPDYAADALPPELASMPAVKPGSRGLV